MRKLRINKINIISPLAKSAGLCFSVQGEMDTDNQSVKSTLLVDPAGQKPNTLNPDLVK